ncbi:peptidoglycan DD-metalloendopeptidase family protein [Roseivirga sp. BDSF3-8]|uniref:peptidoglycan DD-metalloendopeptidase family protein n=1 Tax=Roseivirga sp. BDSF3-8 TaxID=3241598 RepID=UPI003531D27F
MTDKTALEAWLKKQDFHEVMPLPASSDIRRLDFTANNSRLAEIDLKDQVAFHNYVFNEMIYGTKGTAGVGGYMEPRVLYQRSDHFGGEEPRSCHLGIDIWMEQNTPVMVPYEGRVHSLADNAGFGNYGPTIILEHTSPAGPWYSLYGHLSRESLRLEEGQLIAKGEVFADLGTYLENGHWPPHLHFQLMIDLQGNRGDFPGVAAPAAKAQYTAICPDPNLILRLPVLHD